MAHQHSASKLDWGSDVVFAYGAQLILFQPLIDALLMIVMHARQGLQHVAFFVFDQTYGTSVCFRGHSVKEVKKPNLTNV